MRNARILIRVLRHRSLSGLLWLVLLTSPALTRTLFIGEPVAPITPVAWRPEITGPPTDGVAVVVFFATWSPTSREIVTVLDRQLSSMSVPLLAITQEDASTVDAFLADEPWDHAAIALDTDRALRRAYLDEVTGAVRLPYGFILRFDPEPMLLWLGRLDGDRLSTMTDTLHEILGDRYDLATRRAEQKRYEKAFALMDELATLPLDAKAVQGWLDRSRENSPPADLLADAMNGLNRVAWGLVTLENATDLDREVGLAAALRALAYGGDRHPHVMDTHAHALWEIGRKGEALAVQGDAVKMAEGTGWFDGLLETLQGYERSLELPVTPSPATHAEPWTGSVDAVWRRFDPERDITLVHPADDSTWAASIADLTRYVLNGATIATDDVITSEARQTGVLVLYGTPEENALTAQVLDHHGIALTDDGLTVGDQRIAAARPGLIAALPAPWDDARPVVLYTAYRREDARTLHETRHGGAPVEVVSYADSTPRLLFGCRTRLEDGRVSGFDVGPRTLSSEEAIADIRELETQLRTRYAGFEDMEWTLQHQGSSWSARTSEMNARLREQSVWSWSAFYDLTHEYLSPVQDTHFSLRGTGLTDAGADVRRQQLVTSSRVYLASVRLRARGDTWTIDDGPSDLLGTEVRSLPIVPGPLEIELGATYAFPTLPVSDGETRHFLVGGFGIEEEPVVVITLETSKGPSVSLPVHPGRAQLDGRSGAWSMRVDPGSELPILAVRTMNPAALEGLAETAVTLRSTPGFVLDLRANGGGSDTPARQWCRHLTNQILIRACGTNLDLDTSEWSTWLDAPIGDDPGPDGATEPYAGRVFVLTDRRVASSGETFALLAQQLPGAILVGENTAGCARYGNLQLQAPLSHSRIRCTFGHTKFVWECVHPITEGVGLFPDYWVDVSDPIGLLSAE